jgi:hypothetical protein
MNFAIAFRIPDFASAPFSAPLDATRSPGYIARRHYKGVHEWPSHGDDVRSAARNARRVAIAASDRRLPL